MGRFYSGSCAASNAFILHHIITMTDDPVCKALAEAKAKKGWDYKTIASKLGEPEQHVIDVFTGHHKATKEEFDNIARVLDIHEQAPHNPQHSTVG
ncbi:hypothetical protein CTheo_4493 [Ceratobasidium theobromae]|uniref:HTH cro/C1-type domain-containing protein n=1 Tax=Ceratobasidium theobromae TaxID=1582974 RepID=A0A5N5QKN7_9AGAM|nr:hypothetical protein CTheo_4493 [Ceratobasidium theobromae]